MGFAEAHPVDDARVVERVGNDGICCVEKRFKNPSICIESRGIQDRILCPVKCCNLGLKRLVDVLCATYKSHTG